MTESAFTHIFMIQGELGTCVQTSQNIQQDPQTNEIFQKDVVPAPEGDKKLNERLKPVEINQDDLKEEFDQF